MESLRSIAWVRECFNMPFAEGDDDPALMAFEIEVGGSPARLPPPPLWVAVPRQAPARVTGGLIARL